MEWQNQAMANAGLYVHVPFCSRVCPYCDFAVRTGGPLQRANYLRSLLGEIAMLNPAVGSFDTIYFGGGTPSCLAPDQLSEILGAIATSLPIAPRALISLEANPEDVSPARAAAWRQLGVSTLSLGVQSFDDAALAFLGRAHSGAQAQEAVRCARQAGFPIVAVDLMFGLPGQTASAWARQLDIAIALQPEHLSCYQLTIHAGTGFGKRQSAGKLSELPESEQSKLYALATRRLAAAGYEHYEVSNYALGVASRSRHNQKYWTHAPYLGIGPSAHSFDGSARRWWNHRRLRDYVASIKSGVPPIDEIDLLDPTQLALEAVILGLRCSAGIDLAALQARTGIDLRNRNAKLLARFSEQGLITVSDTHIAPTCRGMAVADYLVRELK